MSSILSEPKVPVWVILQYDPCLECRSVIRLAELFSTWGPWLIILLWKASGLSPWQPLSYLYVLLECLCEKLGADLFGDWSNFPNLDGFNTSSQDWMEEVSIWFLIWKKKTVIKVGIIALVLPPPAIDQTLFSCLGSGMLKPLNIILKGESVYSTLV